MVRTTQLLIAFAALSSATAQAQNAGHLDLEFSGMPYLQVRQIEGPARDDTVATDLGAVLALRGDVTLLSWLRAGLMLGFDMGNARGTEFASVGAADSSRIDSTGGSYWELWTTLIVRGEVGPFFGELGWAPLIVRADSGRPELYNVDGQNEGLFLGSRSVAYLAAIGGQIPVGDALHLTLRLQFRIRYLVERGGSALANDEEFGQMHLWPQIGLRYSAF